MTEPGSVVHTHSFLDSIWARLLAALIAVGGIALFYATNDVRLPGTGAQMANSVDAGYQRCLDERMAAVEHMAKEAGFTLKQKELAQARAAETCRNLGAGQ